MTIIIKMVGNIEKLINTLNSRINGWINYFKHSDAQQYGDLPRKMDLWLNNKIRKWIRRTTKIRGKDPKFWKQDTKDWILYHTNKKTGQTLTLKKYNSVKWSIYDYKAIPANFSPYSLTYEAYQEVKLRSNFESK